MGDSSLIQLRRGGSSGRVKALAALTVCLCLALVGCGGGSSSSSSSSSASAIPSNIGTVEVAFVASPGQPFQSATLNVVAVRLNPSNDAAVPETDKHWQNISVPPGNGLLAKGPGTMIIGSNAGTSVSKSADFGQVAAPLDFTQLGGIAQLFNAGAIKPQTYNQVELILSPANNGTGTITPICGADPAVEGCVSYPLILAPGIGSIRATIPGGLNVVKKGTVPLVLEINLGLPNPPLAPFTISPTITVVPNNANGSNPDLALVTGKVTGTTTSTGTNNKPIVNAVLSTTGQFVANVTAAADGSFDLSLPALPTGTSYELYSSGPGRSYFVMAPQTLAAGDSTTINFAPTAHGTQQLRGAITDLCTGLGIQGATLQLFAQPNGSQLACATTYPIPAGCVMVASASSNVDGSYPLPTISGTNVPFNSVPTDISYAMRVTASGYDPAVATVSFEKGKFTCKAISPTGTVIPPTSKTKGQCRINLARAQLTGTVSLAAPNTGPNLGAMVIAEDQGTNHLENTGLVTIPSGANSAQFTMLVPTSTYLAATNPAAPGLDLFVSTKDLFNGVPQSNTGHTIAVLSAVPSTAQCQTTTVPATLGPIACVGHGSFTGSVSSFDIGTTVVMSKGNVQLVTTSVGSSNSSNPGGFGLCAPVDTYSLTHFENGVPGSSVTTTLAPPATIAQPCNSICQPPTAGSCFMCNAATPVTLP
jgi:hypothetical protein